MDDREFWAVIEGAETVAKLRARLVALAPADILAWGAWFDAYYAKLRRYDLWLAAYMIRGGCSDDSFDYFRAGLILRGERVVEAVVADPDTLDTYSNGDECEAMLSVADAAYKRATKRDPPESRDRVEVARAWPDDRVPSGQRWTPAVMEAVLPGLYARHIAASVAQRPAYWNATISRAAYWALIDGARGDLGALRAALVGGTPATLVGFARWLAHDHRRLCRRTGIVVASQLCLDSWFEVADANVGAFVGWLILQGERVVVAAIEDPDSLADRAWPAAPARIDMVQIARTAAAAMRVESLYTDDVEVPDEDWPDDWPEPWSVVRHPPFLDKLVPRLVRTLGVERARFAMPRAKWQREAAVRNRWWNLAWDAVEAEVYACEPARFWRSIDALGWPDPDPSVIADRPFHERVAFAMRYHGAAADPATAAGLPATPAFRAYIDELRRGTIDDLTRAVYDRAGAFEDAASATFGAPVWSRARDAIGFVTADGLVFYDAILPIIVPAAIRAYSAKATYAVEDPITHPKFGAGVVIAKPAFGKILVRFADAERLLVGN